MGAFVKIIAATAAAAIVFCAQNAQARKTDMMVGYGGYTQMDCTDMHDGWRGVNNSWGTVNIGVDFHINDNIAIGPTYTFSSASTEGDGSNLFYHGIMMNLRYNYWSNSIITLYAHGGAGCVITHLSPKGGDSYNKTYLGIQIVPVGAEVGIGRRWIMFGELGFGVQGLLQIGFKYTL